MTSTTLVASAPQLSCYTTNLAAYLSPDLPDVRRRFAESVRLAVRTGLPPGELAFSHHTRVDTAPGLAPLTYRGAADWRRTRAGLKSELALHGRVLAVGNVRHLPWSAGYGRADAPHWLLVHDHRDACWLVADHFTALTPHGPQEPHLGWLDDDELALALTPVPGPAPEVALRDRLALGGAAEVPAPGSFRWLEREAASGDRRSGHGGAHAVPDEGTWLFHLPDVLSYVRDVLVADPTAPGRYADDLWAAGCHYTHRLTVLGESGAMSREDAATLIAAWAELPRALRFADRSAGRGRPRAGLIGAAFDRLLDATQRLPQTLHTPASPVTPASPITPHPLEGHQ
ncbi:hypothetical protein GCM10009837_85410 [Streptomyces durmitorensis]|uniref:Uncharacterized protein n=1 Tax=Streptomyces durmitorensis TaxID=319947 RepID=A0ABY4PPJ5_9ACTN|nr:hypothetical protein [Streptomyces durmitorensis]UQT54804.1 hypothetical protein M4V62_06685 [Streptomyces durmitorensis]